MNTPREDDAEAEQEESAGASAELIKSYLAFALRAVRARLLLTSLTFLGGAALAVAAAMYYPRTFVCTTVLMGQGSMVLEGMNAGAQAFPGAANLIVRKENLEAIVRQTGLVKKALERRPPLVKFKDGIREKISGKPDEKTMIAIMVGTIQGRTSVVTDWSTLTVNVAWTDPRTAAELAEAARESYVKNRHAAEMSAFEEKTTILEGHSARVREEIEALARQISQGRQEDELATRRAAADTAAAIAASKPSPNPVPVRVETRRSVPNERQQALKQELEEKKRRLAELENERERQMREGRAKIADLKLRLMPSHPEVETAEQRLALLAQVPSEVMLLRSEIQSIETEVSQLESLEKTGVAAARAPARKADGAVASEPLPSEIIGLLKQDDANPILVAQLSGAVTKYGALRDAIRSGRIELDTAQAAFNQRYKLIVPAEPPGKPIKPNVFLILGGGLAVAFLLSLAIPVLLELRTGIMVERWQVHHVQLPVLAELRLPTRSSE